MIAVSIVAVAAFLMASEGVLAGPDEAMLIWNQGRYDYEVTEALEPVTFHLSVKVGSERELVEAKYQVEGPIGWRNIYFEGGSEPNTGWWPTFYYIPGKTYSLNVTITPPRGALNATHWFDLRGHLEDNLNATHSIRIGVIVRQYADFEWGYSMTPPPHGEFSSYPSNQVTVKLALYNMGNGHDTFTIDALFEPPEPGWVLEFVNGADAEGVTPPLPPDPFKNAPQIIEVTVAIPTLERAGMTAQVTLNATSGFDPSVVRPPAFFSVTALQYYNFQVNVTGPSSKEGIPGGEVVFTLRISNLGNGWDTFTIKPIWNQDANPGFVASADPRVVDVDARTVQDVDFVVKAPEGSPKNSYHFTAEVRSSCADLDPIRRHLVVNIGQHYSFELMTQGSYSFTTIPGGNLEVEVTVHNTGNGLDQMMFEDVIGVPAGWLTHTRPSEVTLLQGQSATVKVIIIVPSQREEAPMGEHHLTVRASSTRSEATDDLLLVIEVVQHFRVEWVNSPIQPRRTFNPYQKDTINVTLELKNYGNGVDRVNLEGHSPDPRVDVTLDVTTIHMAPDEARPIGVTIRVDRDLPPGLHQVFVNATSQGPDSVARVAPVDFGVVNVDAQVPPIPTYIDPYTGVVRSVLRVDEDINQSFKLKVENNGTRPLNGVLVRVFDVYWVEGEEVRWNFFNFTTPPIAVGDRFIVGERPFTERNPPLYWWANRTGNHTLRFQVYYPHQSNTDNDVSILNIMVQEVPERKVDDGFPFPDARWTVIGVLVVVLVSVTAFGLHKWIEEIKRPLRPEGPW